MFSSAEEPAMLNSLHYHSPWRFTHCLQTEFPLSLPKWCLFPEASDKVMLGERWSDTVIHLAWLCLFPLDMGSDTFPAGNYMLSSLCALCSALWETLKSPETRVREPSWGESSGGRLFHCNLGIALQVWSIEFSSKKMQFREAEQGAKPLWI